MKVYIVETWYPGDEGSNQIDSIFLLEDKAKEYVDDMEAKERKRLGKNYQWSGIRVSYNDYEVKE